VIARCGIYLDEVKKQTQKFGISWTPEVIQPDEGMFMSFKEHNFNDHQKIKRVDVLRTTFPNDILLYNCTDA
jgi:hypothetical protein